MKTPASGLAFFMARIQRPALKQNLAHSLTGLKAAMGMAFMAIPSRLNTNTR